MGNKNSSKWIALFMILFIFQTKAYADSVILDKNNMKPYENTSIEIISTNSQIHIKNQKCYIENDLILKNHKKEKMTMGMASNHVSDLKILLEGKEISTSIKKGQKNQNWYVWEIPNTKEQVNLKISYYKENKLDSSEGEKIRYSIPKNHIHYGKVTFMFDEGLDPQDIKIKEYDKYEDKETVNIEMIPKENQIIFTFYDYTDDFNIELYYKNDRKIEKEKLLDQEKRTKKEIEEIKDLGQRAYDAYMKEEYEKAISYMEDTRVYQKNKDKEVSEYALKMTNFLDYYRGCIYKIQGNQKDAIYYFKSSGILYNRNLYDLLDVYHTYGNIDEYMTLLKKIVYEEGKEDGIRIWAQKEINNLPDKLKQKHGLETLEKKSVTKNKEKFSFQGFLFFNTGISILLLVVFWNIKKEKK
ncbi:hypothetical protein [Anaerophilus nitritogenes]|uniref:hypothetical protein n=1 Tax=Anaerophilus nitritogenes TaxID=2498136 RepID=UPI00101C0564|nr:hypothetical protein [Anaerophilus nitritogenes]